MDTFFATKKSGKSARGYTMMQLFVTDKDFVHVVLMKSWKEVLHALKQFTKEIGAPDAFVCDAAPEQMSDNVRQYCSSDPNFAYWKKEHPGQTVPSCT